MKSNVEERRARRLSVAAIMQRGTWNASDAPATLPHRSGNTSHDITSETSLSPFSPTLPAAQECALRSLLRGSFTPSSRFAPAAEVHLNEVVEDTSTQVWHRIGNGALEQLVWQLLGAATLMTDTMSSSPSSSSPATMPTPTLSEEVWDPSTMPPLGEHVDGNTVSSSTSESPALPTSDHGVLHIASSTQRKMSFLQRLRSAMRETFASEKHDAPVTPAVNEQRKLLPSTSTTSSSKTDCRPVRPPVEDLPEQHRQLWRQCMQHLQRLAPQLLVPWESVYATTRCPATPLEPKDSPPANGRRGGVTRVWCGGGLPFLPAALTAMGVTLPQSSARTGSEGPFAVPPRSSQPTCPSSPAVVRFPLEEAPTPLIACRSGKVQRCATALETASLQGSREGDTTSDFPSDRTTSPHEGCARYIESYREAAAALAASQWRILHNTDETSSAAKKENPLSSVPSRCEAVRDKANPFATPECGLHFGIAVEQEWIEVLGSTIQRNLLLSSGEAEQRVFFRETAQDNNSASKGDARAGSGASALQIWEALLFCAPHQTAMTTSSAPKDQEMHLRALRPSPGGATHRPLEVNASRDRTLLETLFSETFTTPEGIAERLQHFKLQYESLTMHKAAIRLPCVYTTSLFGAETVCGGRNETSYGREDVWCPSTPRYRKNLQIVSAPPVEAVFAVLDLPIVQQLLHHVLVHVLLPRLIPVVLRCSSLWMALHAAPVLLAPDDDEAHQDSAAAPAPSVLVGVLGEEKRLQEALASLTRGGEAEWCLTSSSLMSQCGMEYVRDQYRETLRQRRQLATDAEWAAETFSTAVQPLSLRFSSDAAPLQNEGRATAASRSLREAEIPPSATMKVLEEKDFESAVWSAGAPQMAFHPRSVPVRRRTGETSVATDAMTLGSKHSLEEGDGSPPEAHCLWVEVEVRDEKVLGSPPEDEVSLSSMSSLFDFMKGLKDISLPREGSRSTLLNSTDRTPGKKVEWPLERVVPRQNSFDSQTSFAERLCQAGERYVWQLCLKYCPPQTLSAEVGHAPVPHRATPEKRKRGRSPLHECRSSTAKAFDGEAWKDSATRHLRLGETCAPMENLVKPNKEEREVVLEWLKLKPSARSSQTTTSSTPLHQEETPALLTASNSEVEEVRASFSQVLPMPYTSHHPSSATIQLTAGSGTNGTTFSKGRRAWAATRQDPSCSTRYPMIRALYPAEEAKAIHQEVSLEVELTNPPARAIRTALQHSTGGGRGGVEEGRKTAALKTNPSRLASPQAAEEALNAEAWEEVGDVLHAITSTFNSRTLVDESAWRYGRNHFQMAGVSFIGAVVPPPATLGGVTSHTTGVAPPVLRSMNSKLSSKPDSLSRAAEVNGARGPLSTAHATPHPVAATQGPLSFARESALSALHGGTRTTASAPLGTVSVSSSAAAQEHPLREECIAVSGLFVHEQGLLYTMSNETFAMETSTVPNDR